MTQRDVKYIAQDFETFNSSYKNFLKSYFPQNWRDFSEASTGQALLDILAYSSDLLSFYLDRVAQELILDNAVQKESVYAIARMLGYKPQKKAASLVDQTIYIEVPATYTTGVALPDYRFALVAKRGSTFLADNGTKFETLYDVDFTTATGSLDYKPSQTNRTTSKVEYFALKKNVLCVSAVTKKKTFNINEFLRYRKLIIDDADSLDVFDVIDSSGNKWYEVDYLAQDTVFEASVNTNYDNSLVPFVLKLRKVPRRFTTEFDYKSGYLSLNFGSGKSDLDDDAFIPNISELSIPLYGKTYFSDFSIDPQNFLNTQTLGITPYNTILDVFYRSGGGEKSVVKAGSINKADNVVYEFKYTGLDEAAKTRVINSLSVNNLAPSQGGRDEQTIFEIKQNSKAFFAAQSRCVTIDDYVSRLYSLPSIFGSFAKVSVNKKCLSPNMIDIIVLSYDENKSYSNPTETLVTNAKTYLKKYAMLTDSIVMRPAKIIYMTIDFIVVCNPNANRNTVLAQCINFLIDYFNKDRWSIGAPIIRSDIIRGLQEIGDVYAVSDVKFTFSDDNVKENDGIITCPTDAIFEIDNPQTDINGVIR